MHLHPLRPSPSPRIEALRSGGGVETFWNEVAAAGAPLIEPDPQEADSRLVTFLWRGPQPAVLLLTGVTDHDQYENQDISPHALEPLPGTDIRYSTYRLRADVRASYLLYPGEARPVGERESWLAVIGESVPDPFNPKTTKGAFGQTGSLVELSEAPPMPYAAPVPGVPAGELRRFTREYSAGDRPVWVYLPAGHSPDQEYPVTVLLDGRWWAEEMPVQTTLDNLIAEGRIPPMIAVLVGSANHEERGQDLVGSEPFTSFLTDDVLAWAAGEFGATTDPARTVIAGQSLGGLAAAHAALVAPQRFGNVLSQSGSFWWPEDDLLRAVRQFAAAEPVPARFFVQVGRHETLMMPAVDAFTDVLTDHGSDFVRADFTGGHEYVCWLGGIADGLIHLAGDWPR